MYLPQVFEQTNITVLHDAIERYPLGTLITVVDGAIEANHLPFVLHRNHGAFGVLRGHVARGNDIWRVADGADALVMFHGPEGYISPSWYAAKADTGKVVPTWNYIVVHARGAVRVIDEARWIREHVESLTRQQESRRDMPWNITDAPPDYLAAMVRGIVGIEIAVRSVVGKWKLSQNRSPKDRQGVVDGLRGEAQAASALADEVNRALSELTKVPGSSSPL